MCGGGGGGGGANESIAESRRQFEAAEQKEAERKARIEDLTNKVNAIFSDPKRESLFTGAKEGVISSLTPSLNRQREAAARESKFALARQGLLGGKQEIDNAVELDRRYQEGLQDVYGKAAAVENNARATDARNKLSLVGRVQSGENEGSVLADAINSINMAQQSANTELKNAQLGNFFENAGQLFTKNAAVSGMNRGNADLNAMMQQYGLLQNTGKANDEKVRG